MSSVKEKSERLVEELISKGTFKPKEGKKVKHAIKKSNKGSKSPIPSKNLSSDIAKKPQ